MNSTVSLSEQYRCSFPETRAVTDEFLSWKKDMKTIWISGASVSVLGFCLLVASAIVFPAWRMNVQNKVWLNMCGPYLTFLIIYISRDFSICYGKSIIFVLTYLCQVVFCWLMVGAWVAYKKLVIVFLRRDDGFMTRVSLLSWLIPLPFSLLRLTLDTVVYPDILFGNEAKRWIKINGHAFKLRSILELVYFVKDVAMYFPVFMTIMGSTLLYLKVVYVLLWKRKDVTVNQQGLPASARQDRTGNAIIAIMFLIKSGIQFLVVMFNRFYTFTEFDYCTAFMISYHIFICAMVFVFAMKSSRDLWVGLIRKNINR